MKKIKITLNLLPMESISSILVILSKHIPPLINLPYPQNRLRYKGGGKDNVYNKYNISNIYLFLIFQLLSYTFYYLTGGYVLYYHI